MRLGLSIIAMGSLMAVAAPFAAGQSAQEWNAYKVQCGLSSTLDYNSWVASGSPCNSSTASPSTTAAKSGLTASQQQLATALGQAGANIVLQGLHNLLVGQPAQPTAPLDPAAQQKLLAAEQLNNSGIYLYQQGNYLGALNEFQQALALDPNDKNILSNVQAAKQKLQDAAQAEENSDALSSLLGSAPGDSSPLTNPLNHVNLNPNANSIDAVLHGSDGDVVNLSSATKTSIDPATIQGQIDTLLGRPAPSANDIDKILPPSQGKTDAFNAQCSTAAAGSAAYASCQQQAEQLKDAQKHLDDLSTTPAATGPHN